MITQLSEPILTSLGLDKEEEVEVVVESDLTGEGTFGEAFLVASGRRVWRVQAPSGRRNVNGQAVVDAVWNLDELSAFRYDELVDAGSLVAEHSGRKVELIRSSAVHSARLITAAKRLNRLATGEDAAAELEDMRLCPKCRRPLPKDTNVCEFCVNRGKTLLRLLGFLRPYKKLVAVSAALLLLGTALELVPGMLAKSLFDEVLIPGDPTLFVPIILGLVGARITYLGVQMARGRLNAFIGNRVTVDIRARLFAHFQALSLSFYDRRTVGSVMSRMTNDTGALYDVLVDGIPLLLSNGLLLVAIPIVLFTLAWEVALWTLLPAPLILYLVFVFRRKIMRVWRRFWQRWSRLSGALNGVLSGMRVVKAFRGEDRETEKFRRRIQDLADTGYAAEVAWATFFPVIMFLVGIGMIIVYYVGGLAVLEGMSIGTLFAFFYFLGMLQAPMQSLSRLIDWTSRALTASERVFEVLDTVPDIQQPKTPVQLKRYEGRVRFRNVRFGYEKAHEVLHDIDFEAAPGEMIGIVGASGSGKTTLMNLLLRFYDPIEGSVEIDGVDLRELDIEELRQNVGVVPQEPYLFSDSVRGNIAYGRPQASLEDVIAAADAANAHDFIVRFPDGYDSYVGERGQRLSGGERQRISIARAILHNPKILVLDEATSSVDTETERMIQEAVANLVSGRTVFAIAHRLSTLKNADRIIVMDEGKIAEVGTHDELMNLQGIYHRLVTLQSEMAKVRADFIGVEEEEMLDEEQPVP